MPEVPMDARFIKGFIKTIATEGYGVVDEWPTLHTLEQILITPFKTFENDTGIRISGGVRTEVRSVCLFPSNLQDMEFEFGTSHVLITSISKICKISLCL